MARASDDDPSGDWSEDPTLTEDPEKADGEESNPADTKGDLTDEQIQELIARDAAAKAAKLASQQQCAPAASPATSSAPAEEQPKKRRGRPRKIDAPEPAQQEPIEQQQVDGQGSQPSCQDAPAADPGPTSSYATEEEQSRAMEEVARSFHDRPLITAPLPDPSNTVSAGSQADERKSLEDRIRALEDMNAQLIAQIESMPQMMRSAIESVVGSPQGPQQFGGDQQPDQSMQMPSMPVANSAGSGSLGAADAMPVMDPREPTASMASLLNSASGGGMGGGSGALGTIMQLVQIAQQVGILGSGTPAPTNTTQSSIDAIMQSMMQMINFQKALAELNSQQEQNVLNRMMSSSVMLGRLGKTLANEVFSDIATGGKGVTPETIEKTFQAMKIGPTVPSEGGKK